MGGVDFGFEFEFERGTLCFKERSLRLASDGRQVKGPALQHVPRCVGSMAKLEHPTSRSTLRLPSFCQAAAGLKVGRLHHLQEVRTQDVPPKTCTSLNTLNRSSELHPALSAAECPWQALNGEL